MGEHAVASAGALAEGGRLLVDVDGESVGLFKWAGNVYALRNQCAHQGGPVCEGKLVPAHRARVVDGRVREFLDPENPVIACPWHGWEYDLRTGTCLADPRRGIRSYPVGVRGDEIVVDPGISGDAWAAR